MRSKSVLFNPFDEGFRSNPYPFYARLRDEEPIHRAFFGSWCVSSYELCEQVLKDPSSFGSDMRIWSQWKQYPIFKTAKDESAEGAITLAAGMMIFRDGADHVRIRRHMAKAFTPRALESLQEFVDQSCEALVREAGDKFDLLRAIAEPLPVAVISRMLSIPEADRSLLRTLAVSIREGFEPMTSGDALRAARQSAEDFLNYFRDFAEQEHRFEGNELVATLFNEAEAGDVSRDELLANLFLLFFAGHETTVNLIGNGALCLATHPGLADRLREEPQQMGAFIEEVLRFESPFQLVYRYASCDVRLGDRDIRRGDQLLVFLGAANRDPQKFDSPDTFDLDRESNDHLSFGAGKHHCLGFRLARMEAAAALGQLLREMPNLKFVGQEAIWRSNILLRGLDSLPVSAN